MGTCQSSSPPSSKTKETSPKAPSNFGRKEGLDPKDFIFKEKQNETLIKLSPQIDGQQFCLEGCMKCQIFLLDVIGSMFIDHCSDCQIVIGPISSRSPRLSPSAPPDYSGTVSSSETVKIAQLWSLVSNSGSEIARISVTALFFPASLTHVSLATAILLCSLTGPIIESSRDIGFGCYSYGYFGSCPTTPPSVSSSLIPPQH
jgi:hypothetical protein